MPRFFTEDRPSEQYLITGENGRHIVRSLRMRPGETLILCDGRGTDYLCTLLSCGENGALVHVDGERPSSGEPRLRLTVCQCWPKGDKLETVVQKATELGAAEFLPVLSARCVSRPDGKSAAKKLQRLQKIAAEAAQQSQRGIIPQVLPPLPLSEALRWAAGEGDVLFFYEEGRESLKDALKKAGDRLFLFIGPEGGFSPEEAGLARELGAPLLTLGPRILRTETAPIAALSAILHRRDEF